MGRKRMRNISNKVKNYTRGINQIYDDVKEENIDRRLTEATELDEDKPGMGQFFCVECSKYFINQRTLTVHKVGKPHKRRLKALLEEPHTQADADRAAGLLPDTYRPSSVHETNFISIRPPTSPTPTYVMAE